MVELTRCPKCATLYDLEGINLSASGGWVQCGECDRKFKAESYQIDKNEVSFQANADFFSQAHPYFVLCGWQFICK